MIVEVYRRGYLHNGLLLRPAMVVVGRPAETTSEVTE
jgi:molecular chaperone GrpE (heat shock protein)